MDPMQHTNLDSEPITEPVSLAEIIEAGQVRAVADFLGD